MLAMRAHDGDLGLEFSDPVRATGLLLLRRMVQDSTSARDEVLQFERPRTRVIGPHDIIATLDMSG
jgi:hypothetical protein